MENNHPYDNNNNNNNNNNIQNTTNSKGDFEYYCGNPNFISLSYVEVRPLPRWSHNNYLLQQQQQQQQHEDTLFSNGMNASPPPPSTISNIASPSLTSAFIKRQLIIDTHRSMLQMNASSSSSFHSKAHPTVIMMMTNDSMTTRCITYNNHNRHNNIHSQSSHSKYFMTGSLIRVRQDDDDDDDDNNNNNWKDTTNDTENILYPTKNDHSNHHNDILWFRTNEPFGPNTLWPCHCIGYTTCNHPLLLLPPPPFTRTPQHESSHESSKNHPNHTYPVYVSESTLVVIRYDDNDNPISDTLLWKDQFTGEIPFKFHNTSSSSAAAAAASNNNIAMILQTQNTTTIAELQFRIRQLMIEPVYIGTTPHDSRITLLPNQQPDPSLIRQQHIRSFIQSCNRSSNNSNDNKNYNITPLNCNTTPASTKFRTVLRDVALLVHSPNPNDDKLALVVEIASSSNDDMIVHVIEPSALLAKYGINADVALPCIIHTILLQAAVRQQKICLIFDHFDTMLHPNSTSNSSSDTTMPILQSMTSYIQTLLISIQNNHYIPFPKNNPLYHYNCSNSDSLRRLDGGMVLPIQVGVLAIMTCPDHRSGWNHPDGSDVYSNSNNMNDNLLSFSGMGRYRLPNLTSATRYHAFCHVFQQEGITLSPELEIQLPYAAASAIWAHNATLFQQCAQQIRQRIVHRHQNDQHQPPHNGNNTLFTDGNTDPIVIEYVATLEDVQVVFQAMNQHVNGRRNGCDVQFVSDDSSNNNNTESFFHTVGGNQEAKASLQDALCLDPVRRQLLHSFGIAPSTGLLLYGPPGTGKTLLAKAVAQELRRHGLSSSSSSTSIGGAFISLNSSDIVRAEVGESEKLVVQAFHTARTNAPAVIFIDEFQALFTERSSGSSSRLTTTLLQCMDDLQRLGHIDHADSSVGNGEDKDLGRVLVLAATNTPWMIDRAFLRPGRFDRSVLVNLPNHEERISILQLLVQKMKVSLHSDSTDYHHSFLVQLAQKTDGFSGADLAALCRAAAIRCLLEQSEFVKEHHFLDVLDDGLKASSSKSLVRKIEQWRP